MPIQDLYADRKIGIRTTATEIGAIEPESLIRTDDLGRQLDFSASQTRIDEYRELMKALSTAPLSNVNQTQLASLESIVAQYQSLVNEMKGYQAVQGAGPRDDIINRLNGFYGQAYDTITPCLPASETANAAVAAEELGRLKSIVAEAQTQLNETVASLAKSKSEAVQILDSIQSASAEAGVSKNAAYFNAEVVEHHRAAKNWLLATAAIGCLTALLAWFSADIYAKQVTAGGTTLAIQIAVAKLAALSVLYYATIWCARNYLATRHNYTVNRHRSIALSTFETFVKGTSDDVTKNAVLLRATEAVFAPEVTGYLSKEPSPGSSPQLIEIFRGLSDSK